MANAVSLIFWLDNLDAINLGGAGRWGVRGVGGGRVPKTGGVVFEMGYITKKIQI